jgi:hypothetical protein
MGSEHRISLGKNLYAQTATLYRNLSLEMLCLIGEAYRSTHRHEAPVAVCDSNGFALKKVAAQYVEDASTSYVWGGDNLPDEIGVDMARIHSA